MQNNGSITMLRGADRVRKRPAVIFGSSDVDGAFNAVKGILDVFIFEAALGYCRNLDITIHKDSSITILSHDRGIFIDDSIIDGEPAWKHYFCSLFPGPRQITGDYVYDMGMLHHELYGCSKPDAPMNSLYDDVSFSFCGANYVSNLMRIDAVHEGVHKSISFCRGECIESPKEEVFEGPSSTLVHVELDDSVFDSVIIPFEMFDEVMRDLALAIPGLTCEINDERIYLNRSYLFPLGLQSKALQLSEIVPYFAEKKAHGMDRYNRPEYDAAVKISCGFCSDAGSQKCIHNYRNLKWGGVHYDEAQKAVLNALNYELGDDLPQIESFGKIANKLVLFIYTECPAIATNWMNGTRTCIANRMIADITYDLLGEDFRRYIHKYRQEIVQLLSDS